MMNKHLEFLRLESNESEDFESSRGWMTAGIRRKKRGAENNSNFCLAISIQASAVSFFHNFEIRTSQTIKDRIFKIILKNFNMVKFSFFRTKPVGMEDCSGIKELLYQTEPEQRMKKLVKDAKNNHTNELHNLTRFTAQHKRP
jgi:hypothetical protein